MLENKGSAVKTKLRKDKYLKRALEFKTRMSFPVAPVIIIVVCVILLVWVEPCSDGSGVKNIVKDVVIAVLASCVFIISINIQPPIIINDNDSSVKSS